MLKLVLGELFCDVFFDRVLTSILGRFLEAPKPEIIDFSYRKITNFTKSTFSRKVSKNVDFGVVFGGQNDEKSRKNDVEKHVFF